MRYQRGIALIGLMLASGCVEPHNDVLIFGTNTKFALDVSASAASGGVPEVTVGYKRQEAVWMPLLVNGQVAQAVNMINRFYTDCFNNAVDDTTKAQCRDDYVEAIESVGLTDQELVKYMGESEGSGQFQNGGLRATKGEKDAYSVFASFGATFGAEGGMNTAEAQGGIAQFFATGIAAQRLGANASIGDALAVKPASGEQLDAEKQKTQAAVAQTQAAQERAEFYAALLPPQTRERVRGAALEQSGAWVQAVDKIAGCAVPDSGDSRAQAILDSAKSIDAGIAGIESDFLSAATSGRDALRTYLLLDLIETSLREPLSQAATSVCE